MSGVLKFEYLESFFDYFIGLNLSQTLSFVLSILLYVLITFGSVFTVIRLINKALARIKDNANDETIRSLLTIWIFVVAIHIGYTLTLYSTDNQLLSVFIVFTFIQTYYLFLFNTLRLREEWINDSRFVVINLLTNKKYFSVTTRINFKDNHVQIKEENEMLVITNYKLEVLNSNLCNSSKANSLRDQVQRILKSKL